MSQEKCLKKTQTALVKCFKCNHQYPKVQMKKHPCFQNILDNKNKQKQIKITKSSQLPGCDNQNPQKTESMELPGCNNQNQQKTESMKLPGCNNQPPQKIESVELPGCNNQPPQKTESVELPGCNKVDSSDEQQQIQACKRYKTKIIHDQYPCFRCGQLYSAKRVKKHACKPELLNLIPFLKENSTRYHYQCKKCKQNGRREVMVNHHCEGTSRCVMTSQKKMRVICTKQEIAIAANKVVHMSKSQKDAVFNQIDQDRLSFKSKLGVWNNKSEFSCLFSDQLDQIKPKQMSVTDIQKKSCGKSIISDDMFMPGEAWSVTKHKAQYFSNSRLKTFKKPAQDAQEAPMDAKIKLIRMGCILTHCLVMRGGIWRRKDKMVRSNQFIQYLERQFPITVNYDFEFFQNFQSLYDTISPYCGIRQGFIQVLYPNNLVQKISSLTRKYVFPLSLLLRVMSPRIRKFAKRTRVQRPMQLKKLDKYLTKKKYKTKVIRRKRQWFEQKPMKAMNIHKMKSLLLTRQFFQRQYRRAMYSSGRVVRNQNRKLVKNQQNKLAIDWACTSICNIMSANKIFRFFYRQQTAMDHVMRRNDHYYKDPLPTAIIEAVKPPSQRVSLSKMMILQNLSEALSKVGAKQRVGLGGLSKQEIIIELLKRTGLKFQDQIDGQINKINKQVYDIELMTHERRNLNIRTMSESRKNTIISYLCKSKPANEFQSFTLKWVHQYRRYITTAFQKYIFPQNKQNQAFPNSLGPLQPQQIMNLFIQWLSRKGLLEIQDVMEIRYMQYMKQSIQQEIEASVKSVGLNGPFVKFTDVQYISSLKARSQIKLDIQIDIPVICEPQNWRIVNNLEFTPEPLYTYDVIMNKAIAVSDDDVGNYIACSNQICKQWIERDVKICVYCSSTYHIKCPVDYYRTVGPQQPCMQCQRAHHFSWMSVTWMPTFNSALWKQQKQQWLKSPKQKASSAQVKNQRILLEKYIPNHEHSIWCRFNDIKIVQSFNSKIKIINDRDMQLIRQFEKQVYVFPVTVQQYTGKGNGLKATRKIVRNELVAVYSGWIIPNSFAIALFERSRNKQIRKWKDYIATIFDGPSEKLTYSLIPHLLGHFGHLMNSPTLQNQANVQPCIFVTQMGPVFLLKATRDIQMNEQLQWFYNGRYNDYPMDQFK